MCEDKAGQTMAPEAQVGYKDKGEETDLLKDVILGKWMTVVISALLLATLNQYYWSERYKLETKEVNLTESISTIKEMSAVFSKLIAKIEILQETKIAMLQNAKISEPEKKDLYAMEYELAEIVGEASEAMAPIDIYFSELSQIKVQEVKKLLFAVETKEIEKVSDQQIDGIWDAMEELRKLMSSEVRKELTPKN